MGNFLENLFEQLHRAADGVVLREVRGEQFISVTGRELLERVGRARGYLRGLGLGAGERCALLWSNSIQWIAVDRALMAEGIVVVPLSARQAAAELAGIMKDCGPRYLFVNDAAQGESVAQIWPQAPPRILLADVITKVPGGEAITGAPQPCKDGDLVTIIYTS